MASTHTSKYTIQTHQQHFSRKIIKVLNRILGPHQKAYIPNRFISEATKNCHDTFEKAVRNKHPGLAIMIDFEKAFDSVSFSFIQNTLEIFVFGPNFRKWINILLGNSEKKKKFVGVSLVNGYPTEQFKICLLYTSPSPRDQRGSRMPSSA